MSRGSVGNRLFSTVPPKNAVAVALLDTGKEPFHTHPRLFIRPSSPRCQIQHEKARRWPSGTGRRCTSLTCWSVSTSMESPRRRCACRCEKCAGDRTLWQLWRTEYGRDPCDICSIYDCLLCRGLLHGGDWLSLVVGIGGFRPYVWCPDADRRPQRGGVHAGRGSEGSLAEGYVVACPVLRTPCSGLR